MLVLSRQKDERIVIDDRIVITIVDIRGDKVRLGVEAPPEVSVHRQEIQEILRRNAEETTVAANAPLENVPLVSPVTSTPTHL